MMLRLQANVYALPSNTVAGPEVELRGQSFPTLRDADQGPPKFLATLPVSFEQMQQRVLELERSDCEPDGFFLVTGGAGETFWRLNGHQHEYEGRLHRVELNGECPEQAFDSVLRTLGWPEVELAFELVQEGVTLDEASLRRYAVG